MVKNIAHLRKMILPMLLIIFSVSVMGYYQPGGNSSTSSLISNGSYDDAWLNSSYGKVNVSGDTMTGKLFAKDIDVNGTVFLGLNGNTFSSWNSFGIGSTTYNLYSVNRVWNITDVKWDFGSYPNRPGSAIWVEGRNDTNRTSMMWYTFPPNSTTATRKVFIDMEYATNQFTLQYSNLSGSGNAYACIDSTGKLYRGAPTC